MAALRPYYRTYELPWSADRGEEVWFRKLWIRLLAASLILGLLVWLADVPERDAAAKQSIPPRLAKIVIEREPPPPPPPPQVEPERPRPAEEPRPREPLPPERRAQQARERAARAGLLQFEDQLADIRQQMELTREQLESVENTTGEVQGPTRAERSIITSKVGASSGGIDTAGQSRGFGGGAGRLGGIATTQVVVPLGTPGGRDDVRRSGSGARAGRSREEIELVFDRNKGAIYALYSRAQRENPALQGKVVLEFTISPRGEVTMCRIVSSELADPELERKIVQRVRLFRFESKDVGPVTATKPIEFFPA